MLCTVAALPGAAAREIRAWDGVATSCVDRRATDAPDAAPLTGRLQELGAQHRARILPGALTLVLASRPPPWLSWSTTFKRSLTVVRGLGIFVFMKNHLVPVKSWKPVFKRRNSATLKKGHSIQVNINPTLQKCEHCPVVVKKTQIVFAPSAAWTSTVTALLARDGTRLGDLKENWFLCFPIKKTALNTHPGFYQSPDADTTGAPNKARGRSA